MEAIPLSGIDRHGKIFKPVDTNFKTDVLHYPDKFIGKDELADFVTFELVDQKPGKIYDSVESNSFLFSESVSDIIDEDEYAIISDDEDNVCSANGNLHNGEAFVTIALENGVQSKELNNYKQINGGKQKNGSVNGVVSPEFFINGSCKEPTTNGSLDTDALVHLPRKPTNASFKNMNMNGTIHHQEEESGSEKDLLYSYENTSTPNTDYEMKILAGRNDVSELSLSSSDKEIDDESCVLQEQSKNLFQFRSLSTHMRKPFEDGSFLPNPNDSSITIPLEELRNSKLKRGSTGKIDLFPKKTFPLSASELKMNGPVPVIPTTSLNLERSLPHSLFGKKERSSSIKFAFKGMKRSLSETTPPKESDLDIAYIDIPRVSIPSDQWRGRQFPKKKLKDDTFFEIDDRYDEFISTSDCIPIELEMKTIVSAGVSDDDILSTSTEFTSPGKTINILNDCVVSSRYISFFKQEKPNCRHISLAFFKVNQPKILNSCLDVPYEEVVEQVYTHLIEEVIIYEDEFCTCHDFECSICDDEWFIIK